jgi:putative spermidine/putrescine transport system ATP-binding protein
MRDGWVEQVGTPEDVYAEPATRFVATFIGKINQLVGVVEGAREGWVRWGEHRLAVTPAVMSKFADRQTVVVLVRPEAVTLAPVDAKGAIGENRVPATIEIVTFLGPVTRLSLTASGQRIVVDVTTGDRSRFQRGKPVQIVVPSAACRVLAGEPAGGLR